MSDVSLAGAFLAGLVSFLSPCVLPLVPGYISMLSGIGMEQLRKGELPRSGLFGSSLAFVAGFSAVFISFGASASAVGSFLRQNRGVLAPIAGALILLFGLHLLGLLIKLTLKTGLIIGAVLVVLGVISLLRHAPLFAGFGAIHFFSLSLIGFFGPSMARWLNRDVRIQSKIGQPGVWSAFLLGICFRIWLDTMHRANSCDGFGARGGQRHDCSRNFTFSGLFRGAGGAFSAYGVGHRTVPAFLSKFSQVSARCRSFQRGTADFCRGTGVREQADLALGKTDFSEPVLTLRPPV